MVVRAPRAVRPVDHDADAWRSRVVFVSGRRRSTARACHEQEPQGDGRDGPGVFGELRRVAQFHQATQDPQTQWFMVRADGVRVPVSLAVTRMQDANGQIIETHSVSAGLDYPGVGPEHAWLHDIGRANYVGITDDEALAAFHQLALTEGILGALESSHAVAYGIKLAASLPKDRHVLINLSGRGDKDVNTIARLEGISL